MLAKKTTKPEDREVQFECFIEAARELGCDESPNTFVAAVKKLARHTPVDEKPAGEPLSAK